MSAPPAFKLSGEEGLTRKFKAVIKAVGKRPLRDAVQRAADQIVDEARLRAPVLSVPSTRRRAGALRDDITAVRAKSTDTTARFKIGNTKEIFYAHWQEFGTVHHAAQPFLRPAFDTKKVDAANQIGDDFWSEIRVAATVGT